MMFFLSKRGILCYQCLTEIRGEKNPKRCPKCKEDLPVRYVSDYNEHSPFFVQVFGWSQVGKTVFLSALTLVLIKMSKVWPRYAYAALTDASQRKVREINQLLAKGQMPPLTQLAPQEVYVMILHDMERWGGRTLVTRDCAGEIFDELKVPVEQAPYLLNAPTTFMLVSLPDLANSDGRSMEFLMNNYINTLMENGINFKKERRKLVVVLTKGDLIPDLPANLRNYLISDPLWAAINDPAPAQPMDAMAMQEYMEIMGRVSDVVRDWIQRDASGKNFVRLAEKRDIEMRFSVISSTGAPVGEDGSMPVALAPRRVLDPYLWALELQSRP